MKFFLTWFLFLGVSYVECALPPFDFEALRFTSIPLSTALIPSAAQRGAAVIDATDSSEYSQKKFQFYLANIVVRFTNKDGSFDWIRWDDVIDQEGNPISTKVDEFMTPILSNTQTLNQWKQAGKIQYGTFIPDSPRDWLIFFE